MILKIKKSFCCAAVLCTALFVSYSAPVMADAPPPAGYEEKCKVELKEQDGTSCQECENGPGGGGDLEACKKKYAGTKFSYVCKTWGASFWTEVWCDGPPRVEEEDGCSCSSLGTGPRPLVAGVFAGLAVLGLALRRRRGT